MMSKILWFLKYAFIGAMLAVLVDAVLDAQQQPVRQTDPDDIRVRQRIDGDLYEKIWLLDRQIQADTVCLTGGDTLEVVQLDHKYPNKNFVVIANIRVQIGQLGAVPPNQLAFDYVIIPISDSSFTIKHSIQDSSTVNWMTIHKGD